MKHKFIERGADLDTLLEYLRSKSQIAIDLEFDKNRYQYGFTMCLMQVFDGSVCYLIDPLSKAVDITKTFPLIEDPAVMKIGFELGEDLRLFHLMGCSPKNIYDVSIAAKLLDHGQTSLVNLIGRVLGISTSKGSQKSNWLKRPLTSTQLEYAAEDVVFLFQLKEFFEADLKEKGMLEWVEQERVRLEDIKGEEQDVWSYIKSRDMKGVKEQDWQVFIRLMEFREELAKKYNKPSYQVLDKEYLLGLAQDESMIRSFDQDAHALRLLRTGAFKQRLLEIARSCRAEMMEQGVGNGTLAWKQQDKEESRQARERKRREDAVIDTFLKPIQSSIKQELGEEAGTFIVGNRLMRELASGIKDGLLDYKKELLLKHAKKAGVDLRKIQVE